MGTNATMLANEIVLDAATTARLTSQFKPFDGHQEAQAMRLLNALLEELNQSPEWLPFYTTASFTTEAGKKRYVIGNGKEADVVGPYWVGVNYLYFIYSNLEYPVNIIPAKYAYSSIRATNANYLPKETQVYLELGSDGQTYTVVDFYANPDQAYTMYARVKPALSQVTPTDTISELPLRYRHWLVLELARRLVPIAGSEDHWTANVEAQYQEAKRRLKAQNTPDLSLRPNYQMSGNGTYTGWFWLTGTG